MTKFLFQVIKTAMLLGIRFLMQLRPCHVKKHAQEIDEHRKSKPFFER
jgi:hypothetical protein